MNNAQNHDAKPPAERDLTRSVSEFLTPVETALQASWTVEQAFTTLRSRPLHHKISYFYIVDPDQRLLGVVPTRTLLLADPSRTLSELAEAPAIHIASSATLSQALEVFARHRLLALPVVDEQGRLLGIVDVQVYTDEVLDLAKSRQIHDLFQLMGVSVEQLRRGTALPAFAERMPWLLCNIVGGIGCALIAQHFHLVLGKVLLLAMFIPLVLTLSESISIQSMTLTLYYLHGPAPRWRRIWHRLTLEWRTSLLLGVTCAVCVMLASSFWGQGPGPAAVIGLSIIIAALSSATLGVILPTLLHRLRLDPKVAAGPVVLTLGDIATTAAYLGVATWWLT